MDNSLQLQQLESKMQALTALQRIAAPSTGWIKAVRLTLGMSLAQLGRKLNITKQSAQALERREKEGSVTLRTLQEAANVLDMQLVYGFVPKDASLEALLERKANELARQIVLRTSGTMKLEDQENSKERIERAIAERAADIRNKTPKLLWD